MVSTSYYSIFITADGFRLDVKYEIMRHSKNVIYYLKSTAFKGAASYMGLQI